MRSQRIERSLQHSQSVVRIPPLELPSRSLRPRRNINRIIERIGEDPDSFMNGFMLKGARANVNMVENPQTPQPVLFARWMQTI